MATSHTHTYRGRCTDFPGQGQDIRAMVEQAKAVSAAEVAQHCNLRALERRLGYSRAPIRRGLYAGTVLTLATDTHVEYRRSTFQGRPCYFVRHSATEHIFTQEA